jgi:hypothetical protein
VLFGHSLIADTYMKMRALLNWCSPAAGWVRPYVKSAAIAIAAAMIALSGSLVLPQPAEAYPFWAQENYESPERPPAASFAPTATWAKNPPR